VDRFIHRRTFRDIVRGFSNTSLDGQPIYVKHFTSHDQVEFDSRYRAILKSALDKGVPSEKESLEFQKSEGFWTDEDDRFIKDQKNYITALRDNKKALILKSAIDAHNENIKSTEKALEKKVLERNSIIGNTAEKYARTKANDFYIIKSFFIDEQLSVPRFSEKAANELSYSDLAKSISCYNAAASNFEERKIQNLILDEFFYVYFPFSENTVDFFGNPIVQLTDYQLTLIVYTRLFKSIFEKYDKIPEKIRKDPEALLDFGSVSDESREKARSQLTHDSAGASTLVGATKEDLEYLGVEVGERGDSLHDAAVKSGGSLSMEDLMKLHGA